MKTEHIVFHAQLRSPSTKGQLRRNRKAGTVPAVVYSKGQATSISLAVSSLPKEHTRAQVVGLVVDGVEKKVLMREVQVNPLTDAPIHFDFQEVSETDKVNASVPLNFVGLTREQEKEGAFNIRTRYLSVRTVVSQLPTAINVDVSKLKANDSVYLHDLSLPSDIVVRTGKGKNVALASLVKL